MIKDLTVAKRLTLGFGSIVVIGIGIVGYAAFTMRGLSTDIEELASNRMVKVAQFSQIKDNLQTIGRHVRNIIIIDGDQVKYEQERAAILKLRTHNSELLADLDKTVTLPKGRDLFKIITETRAPYNASIDRALQHAFKNENAQASALLFGEVSSLQETLFKAVDDSGDLQQDIADRLAAEAKDLASTSVILMSGLAMVMAAIGSLVAWLSVRNLRRDLGAEPGQLSAAVARVADGDLSQPLLALHGDKVSVLANVARMQTNLANVVANVRSNSGSVATASAQIAQGNQDLSQRTEEQASALQQTAATMEELNTTVRNNADSAKQANQLAIGASAVAAQGGDVVGQVVSTMQGISDSSRRIVDIIGVIDGIAFQTNILALNAAVEAARAGEQGRGFAVVASEVRSLAQRSANAAKEIKTLIGHSVEQVEQGTLLVGQAGKTMGEIVSSIQRVSDLVAEISSASDEQSSGISQVGEAVSQMDQVTQQNAALVEESAAAAESLKGQAVELVRNVAVFKLAGDAATGGMPALAFAVPAMSAERPAPLRAASTTKPKRNAKAAAPAARPSKAEPSVSASAEANTEEWATF